MSSIRCQLMGHEDVPGTKTNHIHRWRIDEPRGEPIVEGRCKCGASKSFRAGESSGEDWGGWRRWRGETPEAPPRFERFRRDSHNLVL